MPRTARTLTPQTVYHVLARGNNRQTVFHETADYERYRGLLRELVVETPTLRCHPYCLMPNHVHLLLYADQSEALVTSLHRLQLAYAWYHRKTYQTGGHLWQGRYKSLPIANDPYLLEAGRYIERNPLAAQVAPTLEAYPWSSYRATGLGYADLLVTLSPAYLGLGPTPTARQAAWQRYLAEARPYEVPAGDQLASALQGW